MFIHLNDRVNPIPDICDALGEEKILGKMQLACDGLIDAIEDVAISIETKGNPGLEEGKVLLTEKVADMAILMDCLVEHGLIDRTGVQFIGRYKRDQWHSHVSEEIHEA